MCKPASSEYARYLPSGEIAAPLTPCPRELVVSWRCVIADLLEGARRAVSSHAAAPARSRSRIAVLAVIQVRLLLVAVDAMIEWRCWLSELMFSTLVAELIAGPCPECVSRCRRFKSERISAAL